MRTLFALLLLATVAHAATSTITGAIKDAQGNPVNGTLVMRLPIPAQDPNTHTAIAPIPVTFQLVNGNVTGGAALYDLATIQPQKLWYSARAYDTTGNLVFYGNYYVTGTTFNIGSAIPTTVTTSNISFQNLNNTVFVGADVILNATGDLVKDTTCSMDGTTANLTCTDGPFTTCPTGKVVTVNKALTGGYPLQLVSTILSCNGSTIAILGAPSTNATGTVTAYWGTDVTSTLQATVTASPGKTIVIAPGNYLFNTATELVTLPSNTKIWVKPGATMHVTGPTGVSAGEFGLMLFSVLAGTSGQSLQNDGIIEGDNTDPTQHESTNGSAVLFGRANNVTVNGSGLFQNLYGFSVHNDAGATNWSVIGTTSNHVGEGINVNADHSNISNNTLTSSGGMEQSGSYSTYSNNVLITCYGQYCLAFGGNTSPGTKCPGDTITGNVVFDPEGSTGAVSLGSCVHGATFSNNTITATTSPPGILVALTPGVNQVDQNIISNNTVTCQGNTIGIFDSGVNNVLVGNKVLFATTRCTVGMDIAGGASSNDIVVGNTLAGVNADLNLELATTGVQVLPNAFVGTGTLRIQDTSAITIGSLVTTPSGAVVSGKLNIADKGTCTMTAGACSAQPLITTYVAAPICYATYTGTGTLAGTIKISSTTSTVTPASTTGTDTAQVNWACLGF